MNFVFVMLIAILPGVAIATFIYLVDKHEPEPINLLVYSFIYGILAVGLVVAIGLPLNELVPIQEKHLTEQAVKAFVIVALLEETSKFLFVRGILYKNKNFNEPLDGIVYAVMVGMGFATAENVVYALNTEDGVVLTRMFTAIPAHATFAVIMGFFLGKAKFMGKKERQYSIWALLVATGIHGVYDYFLFISYVPGMWTLAIISLLIAVILSRAAIKIHQHDSLLRQTK